MGPIETYFATIAIIFVFIGIARGYGRELGSTVVILAVIFLLSTAESRLSDLVLLSASRVFPAFDAQSIAADRLLATLYTLVFVAVVFASYAGKALAVGGKQIPPPGSTYLSILVGLVNGYLVAGTLWYYQERFSYPFPFLGDGVPASLSATAQVMVELLPQKLAPNPALLMVPIAILLLLRARG